MVVVIAQGGETTIEADTSLRKGADRPLVVGGWSQGRAIQDVSRPGSHSRVK
jgi:hypothetical protein